MKWWKTFLKKELMITKKDNEDFKNSNNCWICEKAYVAGDV